MAEKVKFLCGNHQGVNFIFGITFSDHPWHYFDEKDTHASVHNLLPDRVHNLIGTLPKPKTIEVALVAEQLQHYFTDGKFIFKNNQLKTRLALVDKNFGDQLDKKKSKLKITDNLVFICGQTNPLLFINEFEKCTDVTTDKDKMFKIRNFVNDAHRVEFSELYFVSDWTSMRLTFVKKYSLPFTVNKKKELSVNFGEEVSVRSFVERKLAALSAYTTLPFINQIEMVLNEMPCEVSNLFLVNDMMTGPKTKILDFCDSIQDVASTMQEKLDDQNTISNVQNPMNEMELFHFDPDQVSSDQQSGTSSVGRGRGRTRGRGRGRALGRGRYNVASSSGSNLHSESTYSQSTDPNESEVSSVDSYPHYSRQKKRGREDRTTKKGRPSKVLKTIDESTE